MGHGTPEERCRPRQEDREEGWMKRDSAVVRPARDERLGVVVEGLRVSFVEDRERPGAILAAEQERQAFGKGKEEEDPGNRIPRFVGSFMRCGVS